MPCVGEKGVFRFALITEGVAGHASVPAVADNALLKLAPVLQAMADREPGLGHHACPAPPPRNGSGWAFEGDPAPALSRWPSAPPPWPRASRPCSA